MEAHARTPRDLFEGNQHYAIPTFQRPYVWDEEAQWAPLWDDICRVARVLLANPSTATEATHFLGALVFQSRASVSGDVTRHDVIDGQQRATTLQLLLDAIEQVMRERGHTEEAEALGELILNASRFAKRPERFKVWPSRTDREAFQQAMDPRPGSTLVHRIISAHDFFRIAATDWLEGKDATLPENEGPTEADRARALAETIQDRLSVVAIDLAHHEDPQVIFETLNNRGAPLLKADLVKNWVFLRVEKVGGDVEAWAEDLWAEFDDPWWRVEVAQGRLVRARVDTFLQYWLTMRLCDEVPIDRTFRYFVDHATPRMGDLSTSEAFVRELLHDAETFRDQVGLAKGSAEGDFFTRVIENMGLGATTPVFLWLCSRNHHVPDAEREVGLRSLESWAVRRSLLRLTTKDVNRTMVALLKELARSQPHAAGGATRDFLARQTTESRYWPSDDRVKEELPLTRLYSYVAQPRIRLVLEAIENRLRSKYSEVVALPAGLELEHVMPQAWRNNWPTIAEAERSRRDHIINTIGNLTLLSGSLNRHLSDRPWTDREAAGLTAGGDEGQGKRTLIDRHSVLMLNKGLVADHVDAWAEEDIEARSRLFADLICEIWVAPSERSLGDDFFAQEGADRHAWTSEDLADYAGRCGDYMLMVLDRLSIRPNLLWAVSDYTEIGLSPAQVSGALGGEIVKTCGSACHAA